MGGESTHGVLLLHGFGDTPQTLLYLAEYIHAAGFRVHAPLYPGHGTTAEDFFSSSADEWIESARDALAVLRAACNSVSVVGLSMGAAIGVLLAAEEGSIASLVLIAPYLEIPWWLRFALKVRRLWDPFVGPIEAGNPHSIQDPEERAKRLAYTVVNAAAMAQLARVVRVARRALPQVKCPTLVIQSREDPRVSAGTAVGALKRIGAKQKRLAWTNRGGHVITVDYGREFVFAETLGWISEWGGQPRRDATRLSDKL